MRHWPDEGASALEQELLDLLRDGTPEPPDEAREQVFAALSAELGIGAASGAATGAAGSKLVETSATTLKAAGAATSGSVVAGSSASALGVTKLVLFGLFLGGATAGVGHFVSAGWGGGEAPRSVATANRADTEHSEPERIGARETPDNAPERIPEPSPQGPAPAQPGALPVPTEREPSPEPVPGSSVAGFEEPAEPRAEAPAAAKRSQLEAERKALGQARQALRAGNAPESLRLLTELNRRFPRLLLGQEHEALSIRALAASGARAQAQARAQRFVAMYPNSPLTPGVQEIIR